MLSNEFAPPFVKLGWVGHVRLHVLLHFLSPYQCFFIDGEIIPKCCGGKDGWQDGYLKIISTARSCGDFRKNNISRGEKAAHTECASCRI
ncbi:hypothetical protein DS62_00220 [Smithella sp. SC_K08D17]|nr:hypothetical protein KD27_04070 [Smithella sp. D17]KIE17829.1 hypothetical protein DS62_00220 [Smithella sp. SC_K08D17]